MAVVMDAENTTIEMQLDTSGDMNDVTKTAVCETDGGNEKRKAKKKHKHKHKHNDSSHDEEYKKRHHKKKKDKKVCFFWISKIKLNSSGTFGTLNSWNKFLWRHQINRPGLFERTSFHMIFKT